MIHLSDKQLVCALDNLINSERKLTITIIEHLAEVEERGLYLAEGYSSMFQYLEKKYTYSESAAWRRLSAARALRKFPQIRDFLESRAINLSTLCIIAKSLTSENCDELLQAASGKSQREVEKMLIERGDIAPGIACVNKEKLCKEKVELVAVKAGKAGVSGKLTEEEAPMLALFSPASTSLDIFEEGNAKQNVEEQETEMQQVAYRIEFFADKELHAKILTIRQMLSSRYPQGVSIAQMLNTLADNYLKREKRVSRVMETAEEEAEAAKVAAAEENAASNEITLPSAPMLEPVEVRPTRYIPKAVRDKVYARDGGTCAFIGSNGKRCGCSWDLEYEHIVPFALGGSNDASNLMMLCRAHNNYRARQTYGKEFMEKKREQKKGKHFRCGSKRQASEQLKLDAHYPDTRDE